MGIKFSFSILLKSIIKEHAKKVIEAPPLAEYITKRGPYIHFGKQRRGVNNSAA
jgi:hypothetical protein